MNRSLPALYPLPDVGRNHLAADHGYRQFSQQQTPPQLPLTPTPPEFLIIGLFALRLTEELIRRLEPYPERDTDIHWLHNFLSPFHRDYALAKISGRRKDDYIATYHGVVSRMKKQPRYPMQFMQMNPDQTMQRAAREGENNRPEMSDSKSNSRSLDYGSNTM